MADIYRFEHGDFSGTIIKDSGTSMSADDAFAEVDETERTQAIADSPYDPATIALSMNVLILERNSQRIMIESGNIANDPANTQLFTLLDAANIKRDSINIVTVTHAHADHYAGMLDADGNKQFPNARYVMWQPEWAYYSSDEQMARELERGQARHDFIAHYLGGMQPFIEFISPDDNQLVDGIHAFPAQGHTEHHVRFEVTSQGKTLHVIGDAFIHPLCLQYPQWTFPFDHDDERAIATRFDLRDRLQDDSVLVYHFPFPGIGNIQHNNGQYRWQPL